jgi:ligand-binding sensor domain-containing protein/two-component sensor histidine kinase
MRPLHRGIFKPAFIIFYCLTLSCYGQSPPAIILQHISEENGLSDNHIQCIYKDKNEFLWVGTLTGLNLLDGSAITIFKHDVADSNSLCDNNINTITGGKNDLIWIGTPSGLNSLDPFTRKFTLYHLPENIFGETEFISSLVTDKSGTIFIGTPSGLFYFQNEKFYPVIFPGNKNYLQKNNRITNLAIDHEGIVWISTYNGLWNYDKRTNKAVHVISAENDSNFTELFTAVMVDHENKIWIGTWDKGLKKYDPKKKKFYSYLKTICPKNIGTIAETWQPNGTSLIWINGPGIAFEPQKNKFIHLSQQGNLNLDGDVKQMYKGPEGRLWIGSNSGLYNYNPELPYFTHHIFPKSITHQDVSLLEWNHELLICGQGKDFLKAYDDNLTFKKNYSLQGIKKELTCLSIKASGKESIKAGTNNGIIDINLRTGKSEYHPLDFLAKNFEAGNFITNIYEDKSEKWWVFPWRNGIWITDSTYKNFQQVFINFINEGGKPKPLVIGDAVEDKNNNMWLSDFDEGIIFYDRKLNKFTKPFREKEGERYISTQILYHDDYCYSFSNDAIFYWNCDSAVLHSFELPPPMDKPITSIALDSSGNIWLATRQGLLVYRKNFKNPEHFTVADGLIKNDMDGHLICLANDKIVFGSPDYLTVFDAKQLLAKPGKVPNLVLTEALANGKNIVTDAGTKMAFNHSVNNFIFKWAVTDYNNPLKNNYYYELKGIDTGWRYAGNRGSVEFANLSPGNYILLLKGVNSNGINSNKIITIQFEIKRPFWKSAWFLFLCVLMIASVFYFLYRYRLSQVLKLQTLRNKISLDLHDDIGSTLSSISIMSETAIRQNRENPAKELLEEIKENSILLMERMDDIVWSINTKNDSLETLLIRIKDFATKLFEAREINYQINMAENMKEVKVSMEFRQHIYLILKEAINNLVKYAQCSKAEISADYHQSLLNILIKDNGIGFDTESEPAGNGLLNIKKRAQAIKARLEIFSEPNVGTRISLMVKIK